MSFLQYTVRQYISAIVILIGLILFCCGIGGILIIAFSQWNQLPLEIRLFILGAILILLGMNLWSDESE